MANLIYQFCINIYINVILSARGIIHVCINFVISVKLVCTNGKGLPNKLNLPHWRGLPNDWLSWEGNYERGIMKGELWIPCSLMNRLSKLKLSSRLLDPRMCPSGGIIWWPWRPPRTWLIIVLRWLGIQTIQSGLWQD